MKITTSTKTPDIDQLKRINEVVERLCNEHGYNPISANELLKYVLILRWAQTNLIPSRIAEEYPADRNSSYMATILKKVTK